MIGGGVTYYFSFDAAMGNPPFAGGDDNEGVVMYERTQDGQTFIVSGNRRYVVTPRGNLRWVGDVVPPAPASWWQRLWRWVQSWL